MMYDTEAIGNRLLNLRKELKLSRDAFGSKIGVQGSVIRNIEENNNKKINEPLLISICAQYHINKEWLLFGTGNKHSKPVYDTLQQLREEYNLSDIEFAILDGYLKLSDKQREAVENFLHDILSPDPPESTVPEVQQDTSEDGYIDGVAARNGNLDKLPDSELIDSDAKNADEDDFL